MVMTWIMLRILAALNAVVMNNRITANPLLVIMLVMTMSKCILTMVKDRDVKVAGKEKMRPVMKESTSIAMY